MPTKVCVSADFAFLRSLRFYGVCVFVGFVFLWALGICRVCVFVGFGNKHNGFCGVWQVTLRFLWSFVFL